LIRLAIRCRPELADRVLAELVELVPGGVEEDRGEGWVEYAIYGPPGELPALPELEGAVGDGLVEISSSEIPDDWADRWRDFHDPIWIADRLLVRPSWIEAMAREPEIEVVVDPGQAFGTGAHATTALCLELLLELADAGEASGPLVDAGTGSGVLAIAAAKLGWSPVRGFDTEPAALRAAAENAAANDVELELDRLDVRSATLPEAPTVVANLTAPLLRALAGGLAGAPRVLVCSGLLGDEADAVADAFAAASLREALRRERGDWAALLLRSS
jgi:ribosomal protein L11 methyltransferase